MFWDYNTSTGGPISIAPASGSKQAGSLADEQQLSGDPFCDPAGAGDPAVQWLLPWDGAPTYAYVDLGSPQDIASIALYDGEGAGAISAYSGTIGQPGVPPVGGFNNLLFTYSGNTYPYDWVIPAMQTVSSRYILFKKHGPDSKYNEVRICVGKHFTPPHTGERSATTGEPSNEQLIQLRPISVFPNPTSGKLTVVFGAGSGGEVSVINANGVLINSGTFDESAESVEIDASAYPESLYYIRLKREDGQVQSARFVKMN